MATFFFECAIRSALIATGTGAVLWLMRIKTPATRHAAWTAVVIAMLLLPIWTAAGMKVRLRVLQPASSAASAISQVPAIGGSNATVSPDETTFSEPAPSSGPAARSRVDWQELLGASYCVGVVVLLTRLMIGTIYTNRLSRGTMIEAGRATSAQCAAPITVGWFSPVLILPPGWRQWPAAKLEAVLTHENAHARRHDPLVQWFALFNRAIFWFHPIAWWLERRLAILAEEACDAAVLAAGHAPQDYSDYLIDLARAVTREGRRLNVVGMAMPGSGLKPRLRQILLARPAQPISRMRIVCTIVLCVTSSAMFAAGTLASRPSETADQEAKLPTAGSVFDVASIKPCDDAAVRAGGRAGGAGPQVSTGRLFLPCQTLDALVQLAYFRHVEVNPDRSPVSGGPGLDAIGSLRHRSQGRRQSPARPR